MSEREGQSSSSSPSHEHKAVSAAETEVKKNVRGSRSLQAMERGQICGVSPFAKMLGTFSEGVMWKTDDFTDASRKVE